MNLIPNFIKLVHVLWFDCVEFVFTCRTKSVLRPFVLLLGGVLIWNPIVMANNSCGQAHLSLQSSIEKSEIIKALKKIPLQAQHQALINTVLASDIHFQMGSFDVKTGDGKTVKYEVLPGSALMAVSRSHSPIKLKGESQYFYPWKQKYAIALDAADFAILKSGEVPLKLLHEMFHIHFEIQFELAVEAWAKEYPDYITVEKNGQYTIDSRFYSYMNERYAYEKEVEVMMSTGLQPHPRFRQWYKAYEMDKPDKYKQGIPGFLMHFYQITYDLFSDPRNQRDVSELLNLR